MRLLYHFPLDPFSRKVRLALGEKRLSVEARIKRPWERSEELLRLNPTGETPVLVEENDMIVTGNPGICDYLEETYPDYPLLPHPQPQRIESRRLVGWFDWKFAREVAWPILENKVFRRFAGAGEPDSAALRQARQALAHHLSYIELLVAERNWLAGRDFSIADLAAGAFLSCLDYLGDIDWDRNLIARDYYARLKSRPSFRPLLGDTMAGLAPAAHYGNLDF
ncbi:MAG TPA: glutathione S-transferase family protein [Dongiaceae bacterium]|jgi:glutathione S-transferase|nr:glutathione S-transferase family protein [Dongiaceae bacterium]